MQRKEYDSKELLSVIEITKKQKLLKTIKGCSKNEESRKRLFFIFKVKLLKTVASVHYSSQNIAVKPEINMMNRVFKPSKTSLLLAQKPFHFLLTKINLDINIRCQQITQCLQAKLRFLWENHGMFLFFFLFPFLRVIRVFFLSWYLTFVEVIWFYGVKRI